MLIPNHPDDETLAAFAGADPDATGDSALLRHLATCERCTTLVAELRSLTSALADLPDLAPHRPLRFLPPIAAPRPGLADRVGGVIRGIFAPALTAGAALALVGAVGTFAPSLGGAGGAAVFQDAGADLRADASSDMSAAAPSDNADGGGGTAAEAAGSPEPTQMYLGGAVPSPTAEAPMAEVQRPFAPAPDRPIWPMVLLSGVALIVVMLLLRWILAPRAG
jgi:hypothetical protein